MNNELVQYILGYNFAADCLLLFGVPFLGALGIIIFGIIGNKKGSIGIIICGAVNIFCYCSQVALVSEFVGYTDEHQEGQVFLVCVAAFVSFMGILALGNAIGSKKNLEKNRESENKGFVLPEQTAPVQGALVGLEGEYKGARIPLSDEACIVIGRNANTCNIVLSDQTVSRVHCYVWYYAADRLYVIKDVSKTGVYDPRGSLKEKNVEIPLRSGAIIRIGKTKNVFLLE